MKGRGVRSLLADFSRGVRNNYRSALVVLGFFLIWEASVAVFSVPEFILPSPTSALAHLFLPQPDANYNWPLHIRTTVMEFVLSFAVTAVVGILMALFLSWSRLVRELALPLFIFVNSLPIIAIAPIILLWMGYGLKTNVLIAFLVAVLYGISDEFHQSFVPGRTPDVWDVACDAAGALAALALWAAWRRHRTRARERASR